MNYLIGRSHLFGLLVFLMAANSLFAQQGVERPNIVMIFTDDQRADAVGYAGNLAVSTPHLDALARQGLVFENCFVNTSICAISRANLLSGQYPGRHGIDDFFKTFSAEQLNKTVPARLQQAGYQTAFFGKWGIGDSPGKTHLGATAFDYWAGQPMQTCFFHNDNCKYVNFDGFARPLDDLCDCPADGAGNLGFRNRIGTANLISPLHTDAEVVPRQVARFLEGRNPDRPFAMVVFFKAPHSPFEDWDARFKHVTDGLNMPTPAGATLEIAQAEPEIIKDSLGRPSGMQYLNKPGVLDRHMRDYYRLISSLDHGVGEIVRLLKRHGVSDNTVILFTSDNGHFNGEHGLAGKWLMYEPSLRVPGFIYDPRIKNVAATDAAQPRNSNTHSIGQSTRRMVITIDFSATMLALAGLPIPADMTGLDLTKLLADPQVPWREDFYYDHPYGHGGALPRTIGVRNVQFVYTRYVDPTPPLEQLFDLYDDPNQRFNLVEKPDRTALLNTMRARCDELRREVGR